MSFYLEFLFRIGTNLTVTIAGPYSIDSEVNLMLPNPGSEVHTGKLRFHKQNQDAMQDIAARLGYSALNSKAKYGVIGSVSFGSNGRRTERKH